jgi:hypothetical protein
MTIGVSTAAAGNVAGNVGVNLASDGTFNPAGATALPGQTIGVDVDVFAPAVAQVTPTVIDFGTVRVGDTVAAQSINIANTASVQLLNDVLRETSRNVTGPFTVAALPGDLAAGSDADLATSLNTATAGVFTGAATFGFASSNDQMTDLSLGAQSVALMGTVNNLARALFENVGLFGTLSGSGSAFLLDFGDLGLSALGSTLTANLGIRNGASGPADNLDGFFSDISAGSFALAGFDPFFDLIAGDLLTGFDVSINTAGLGLGTFTGGLQLNPFSSFAGLDDLALAPIQLAFRFDVVDDTVSVPEPPTYMLLLVGLMGWSLRCYTTRRRSRRPAV